LINPAERREIQGFAEDDRRLVTMEVSNIVTASGGTDPSLGISVQHDVSVLTPGTVTYGFRHSGFECHAVAETIRNTGATAPDGQTVEDFAGSISRRPKRGELLRAYIEDTSVALRS
jgi:hypothetical protein